MSDYQFKELPEEVSERVCRQFDFPNGAIRVDPGNFFVPRGYMKYAEEIKNFKINPKDTFVVCYPKAGSTWCQEIIWLLLNNCDITAAKATPIVYRSPFLAIDIFQWSILNDENKPVVMEQLPWINATPPPRVMKTHFLPNMLPPALLDTCKVVCCLRNPKDTIVSYYFYSELAKVHDFKGTLEEFVDFFIRDEIVFSPYWGSVKQWFDLRHHPNLLIVMYEDLKRDLPREIKRIADFYSVDLTQQQLGDLCGHLNFSSMSKAFKIPEKEGSDFINPDKKYGFMRKGEIGDWRNHFTPEINSKVDKWIQENMAHIEGLEFYYGED